MQSSAPGPRKLHPTGLVPESLAAQVLDFMNQGGLGLRGLAASAEVVAAECRNDDWIASEVKKSDLGDAEYLQFLEKLEQVVARATAAMKAFTANKDHEALYAAFVEVATQLNDRSLLRAR